MDLKGKDADMPRVQGFLMIDDEVDNALAVQRYGLGTWVNASCGLVARWGVVNMETKGNKVRP